MPIIWCAISGHGYGHAAQVIPVLNALGRLVPDLTAVLRTTVPASFFQDRLRIPWNHQPVQQDVGCLQRGPLQIDVPATWETHRRFHAEWEQRTKQEIAALRSAVPQVVLSDTSYLALWAGSEAGIPAVGLATFTWSEVLRPLADVGRPEHQMLLSDIERYYGRTELALRIAPGLPLSAMQRVIDVGPIAEPAPPRRKEIRAHVGIPDTELLVLIGFGGIPLSSLPWQAMEQMKGYRFIVDGAVSQPSSRILALSSLPFRFSTLLASVDVVMTKPGYGTVVESVAAGVPIVYVRRYNFADEAPLVDYLGRYGRASQLALEDFHSGRWRPALEAVCAQANKAEPPACTGAAEAAAYLAKYF